MPNCGIKRINKYQWENIKVIKIKSINREMTACECKSHDCDKNVAFMMCLCEFLHTFFNFPRKMYSYFYDVNDNASLLQ